MKTVHVFVDGKIMLCAADGHMSGDQWLLRRAPGHVLYNFSQDLIFTKRKVQHLEQELGSSENTQCLPRGCILTSMTM